MAQRWQPKRHTRAQRKRCPKCKRNREIRREMSEAFRCWSMALDIASEIERELEEGRK